MRPRFVSLVRLALILLPAACGGGGANHATTSSSAFSASGSAGAGGSGSNGGAGSGGAGGAGGVPGLSSPCGWNLRITDLVAGIAVDAKHNLLLTGFQFAGVGDIGGHPLPGKGPGLLAKVGGDGIPTWTHAWTGSGLASANLRSGPNDDIILVGSVDGSVDFGGGPLTSTYDDWDFFAARYDRSGKHLWSKVFASPGSDGLLGMGVDAAGAVFMAGSFGSTIDLGGGPLAADGNLFLGKLDPAGNHLWSKSFGAATLYHMVYGVAVDPGGGVILAGSYEDTIDFGDGPLGGGAGVNGAFVVRFDSDGHLLWSKRLGQDAFTQAHNVALDAAGHIIVGGEYSASIDVGGGPVLGPGGFVVALDPAGQPLWGHTLPGVWGVHGLAAVASGQVLASGSFTGTVDLGSGPVSATHDASFIVALDATGQTLWSRTYGDSVNQYGARLLPNDAGSFFACGDCSAPIDLGSGVMPFSGSPLGFDLYLAKLSL